MDELNSGSQSFIFPDEMDAYFQRNDVYFTTCPNNYMAVREDEFPDIRITSAEQCYNLLLNEKEYWKDYNPNNSSFFYANHIGDILYQFDNAKNYYQSGDTINGNNLLASVAAWV